RRCPRSPICRRARKRGRRPNNRLYYFFTYDSCGNIGTRLAIPQSGLAKAPTSKRTQSCVRPQERAMSYRVKERIAECHRRAKEYKRLSHRASNLDEREIYLS